MPLNLMDAHFRSFEQMVLPRLVAQGIGVPALRAEPADLSGHHRL
jgi:hypothetical protein